MTFELKYDPKTCKLFQFANDIKNMGDKPITTNRDTYSILLQDNNRITHYKGATINKCIAKCKGCNFKRIANKRFLNNKQKQDIYNHIDNKLHNEMNIRMIWDFDKKE